MANSGGGKPHFLIGRNVEKLNFSFMNGSSIWNIFHETQNFRKMGGAWAKKKEEKELIEKILVVPSPPSKCCYRSDTGESSSINFIISSYMTSILRAMSSKLFRCKMPALVWIVVSPETLIFLVDFLRNSLKLFKPYLITLLFYGFEWFYSISKPCL